MNRLIIIGNGFDLAHGIKSSFKDFISDYFCNAVNEFYKKSRYSDLLLEIKFKSNITVFSDLPKPATVEDVFEKTDYLNKSRDFDFIFHSILLNKIYSDVMKVNWVDLEMLFFQILSITKNQNNFKGVKKLNSEFEYLKEKLIDYLRIQESKFSNLYNKRPMIDCFIEEIFKDEIVTIQLDENKRPDYLYFLIFNYTNTIDEYLKICTKSIVSDINFIHGDLSGNNGDPIFGFGDEFDKRYLAFEDENKNELFEHIKSFQYLKAKNYYSLTRFIESNDFQVHTYGHSLGLSDRTMLNQIFEHENCKSVKIFYHKKSETENDFVEKTHEISRHFKDKVSLRKKVVPLELSSEMPQPKVDVR